MNVSASFIRGRHLSSDLPLFGAPQGCPLSLTSCQQTKANSTSSLPPYFYLFVSWHNIIKFCCPLEKTRKMALETCQVHTIMFMEIIPKKVVDWTKLTRIMILIYLLTAIGLSPGGSSTVHIYTQTIYRTIQNKLYIEQHKKFGRVWAVPRICVLYPGICLTTEEKARKTVSQGSRRVPVGTMKIHNHRIRTHRHNNKNT